MIGAAVEAPGEAPSRAAMLPSAEVTTSVPNCRTPPPLFRSLLDDLHPLAGRDQLPVDRSACGKKSVQFVRAFAGS